MLIIAFSAILRLMVIGAIGLGDDEAHYFAYSLHPDLSYFDHPPAIGYLIKLSVSIFGHSEFAVRLPAVMLFVGTSLLLWQLARRFYGEKTAFWSVVLLNVTPVFSFLGAVLTVPDALLAFFWMAFLSTFERALSTEKPSWWYSCGVILGMGLLSKYNAILLLPGVFAVLALSPKDRRWLSRVEPYAMLVIALIIFSPVVLWNMENGWASFGFQLAHGFGHAGAGLPAFKPELLGRCIGAQAGYISPFLFIFYWAALIVGVRNWWRVRSFDKLFALSFALPTLLLFNGIASFNEILPHWPAMGYLVLVPLLAHYTGMWMNITWLKWSTFLAWGFGLFLTVLVPLQAVYKILPPEAFLSASDAAKVEDGVGKPEKVDVTNELYGWKAVGEEVARIAAKQPPGTFVLAHRHYIASQLSFYVPGTLPIYCLSDRIDAYDFWQRDLSALDGKDAIFVTDNRRYTANGEKLGCFK
jgi:4-amino-4-deoxy-L-arabinose transferase-like glycosyltransferase